MKEIRQLKEKGKPEGVKDRSDGLVAAMKIQKVWRGFATRRKTRRGKLEEMYLIGMIPRQVPKNLVAIEEKEKVSDKYSGHDSIKSSMMIVSFQILPFSAFRCDTNYKTFMTMNIKRFWFKLKMKLPRSRV